MLYYSFSIEILSKSLKIMKSYWIEKKKIGAKTLTNSLLVLDHLRHACWCQIKLHIDKMIAAMLSNLKVSHTPSSTAWSQHSIIYNFSYVVGFGAMVLNNFNQSVQTKPTKWTNEKNPISCDDAVSGEWENLSADLSSILSVFIFVSLSDSWHMILVMVVCTCRLLSCFPL